MDLRDKLNGIRSQGEVLELKLCDYDEVWKVCPRDAKSLAAWALYEGLNRAGVIQKELLSRERALYSLTREGQDSE
jgi:ADP-sugar diphosphatase